MEFNKPKRKVFVGGVPLSMTEEDLKPIFEQFGSVSYVDLNKTKKGISKGYCFVMFEEIASAIRAVESSIELEGKKLDIDYVLHKIEIKKLKETEQYRKAHFKECSKSITKEELVSFFQQFGPVDKVVMSHSTQKPDKAKSGYVVFKPDPEFKAIKKLVSWGVSQNTKFLEIFTIPKILEKMSNRDFNFPQKLYNMELFMEEISKNKNPRKKSLLSFKNWRAVVKILEQNPYDSGDKKTDMSAQNIKKPNIASKKNNEIDKNFEEKIKKGYNYNGIKTICPIRRNLITKKLYSQLEYDLSKTNGQSLRTRTEDLGINRPSINWNNSKFTNLVKGPYGSYFYYSNAFNIPSVPPSHIMSKIEPLLIDFEFKNLKFAFWNKNRTEVILKSHTKSVRFNA